MRTGGIRWLVIDAYSMDSSLFCVLCPRECCSRCPSCDLSSISHCSTHIRDGKLVDSLIQSKDDLNLSIRRRDAYIHRDSLDIEYPTMVWNNTGMTLEWRTDVHWIDALWSERSKEEKVFQRLHWSDRVRDLFRLGCSWQFAQQTSLFAIEKFRNFLQWNVPTFLNITTF